MKYLKTSTFSGKKFIKGNILNIKGYITELINICETKISDEEEYMLHKFIEPNGNFVAFAYIEGKAGQGKTLIYNTGLNISKLIQGEKYQSYINEIKNTFNELTGLNADGAIGGDQNFGQFKYFLVTN